MTEPSHPTKPDITGRAEIEQLINAFYVRVQADDVIGFIFSRIAKTDWEAHLPKMYAFWDGVLFATPGFRGNPLAVHLALGQKVTLGEREFGRWLSLFHQTVDDLFYGPMATEAKARSVRIAGVMQHHLAGATGVSVLDSRTWAKRGDHSPVLVTLERPETGR